MTDESDTSAKVQPVTAMTGDTKGSAPSVSGLVADNAEDKKLFELLSAYLLMVPEADRRPVYKEVLKRTKDARLDGTVHRGNVINIPMPSRAGVKGRALKSLEEVLLIASPDLTAQLNEIADEVARHQLIRAGGRGVAVEELEKLGDGFDLRAMIERSRRLSASMARSKDTKKSKASGVAKGKKITKPKPD